MTLVFGLLLLLAGAAITLDFRGVGTKLIGFSLFTSAPPWSGDPRPHPDRVETHRLIFGSGVAFLGLIVVIVGLASLI